ncbi:hypothetical protein CABS01_16583 [Colletotrichum abscissum]|uniref:uncharacterized protein n=1 Tax=Colletotrichum abscissum TaxID=1671311 RepID=UPI0027D5914D|nr:uncharacterized protein CABS01_16583 [Colletotrichum abscissum]KAK1519316.1 hypothetical protein CABS01_16583 [Colletotrichum abscissum]
MHFSILNSLTAAALLGFAAEQVTAGQVYHVQLHAGRAQTSYWFSGPDDQKCLLMRIPVSPPARQSIGKQIVDAHSMCCFVYADGIRTCFWHGIASNQITAANCANELSGAERSVTITYDHSLPAQGWGNSMACK